VKKAHEIDFTVHGDDKGPAPYGCSLYRFSGWPTQGKKGVEERKKAACLGISGWGIYWGMIKCVIQ
jgi:hypothetical protein